MQACHMTDASCSYGDAGCQATPAMLLRNQRCASWFIQLKVVVPDDLQEGLKRMQVKPTTQDLQRWREVSPIAHIDKVQAPLFFMLGAKDMRVPMQDAKQYLAALKARKDAPETRVIVFPEDTHALDKPQTEFEQFLNAAWWIKRHLE